MKRMRVAYRAFIFLMSIVVATTASAQRYQPTEENLQSRKEFQDAKFGVFIHWGLYAMLASGEWTMNNNNIDYKDYAQLAGGFYPSKFNADEWVSQIKASGAKYICITSRHHDGFSMWNTNASDFNIVKATPFKRDVLKELADACQRQGMRLHFYYSHLDWSRTDYPVGNTGKGTGRPADEVNWDSYYAFMNSQLKELLTGYGRVGAIWFDGHWDQNKDFDWQLAEQYKMIHDLQPQCLIGNNHHITPIEGEDIQIFERDMPGENKAGFSGESSVSELPLETCETMNGMWGYVIADKNYKSSSTLIQYLVRTAGMNANLLLNIGPQPDGRLPQMAVERLKKIGEWMNVYGETIYGTRGGPVVPHDWGVTTQKENRIFVHIMNLQDNSLFVPLKGVKVKKAFVFKNKKAVEFKNSRDGILLQLPEKTDDVDYVIELAVKK